MVKNYCAASIEQTQLELLQIVFRHGDRTPTDSYPNDIHNQSTWDKFGGLGQLTQRGMQHHYEYGGYLRKRYADFLAEHFDVTKVTIRSTDYDRTIMSAESLLASLYTPKSYQIWNPQLAWQPIAVHTTNAAAIYPEDCPRYYELLEQVNASDEFLKVLDQFKVYLRCLNNRKYTWLYLVNIFN
jgi:hypothetical protein